MLKEFWFKIRNKRTERVPETIADDLKWFLDLNYMPEEADERATAALYDAEEMLQIMEPEDSVWDTYQMQPQSLEEVVSALGQTFQQKLLSLIDAKGYTDSQVYKRANLDRKLFSKIRCNKDYKPSKLTALALTIALELNLDEATDLLGRAGLALSPSSLTDMIIKYCITHQIYDIYDVNALLYEYDQQILGC